MEKSKFCSLPFSTTCNVENGLGEAMHNQIFNFNINFVLINVDIIYSLWKNLGPVINPKKKRRDDYINKKKDG